MAGSEGKLCYKVALSSVKMKNRLYKIVGYSGWSLVVITSESLRIHRFSSH